MCPCLVWHRPFWPLRPLPGSARRGNHDGWVLDNDLDARFDPDLASQGCSALHAVRLVLR